MSAASPAPETPLEAASPFELRVDLAKTIPEAEIDAAIESGDMGFLHSFTTGSAVDGPGIRLVAWTTGCGFRCRFCHNPDTWTIHNGIPLPIATAVDELRKYAPGTEDDEGRFHAVGRGAAGAAPFRGETVPGGKEHWRPHRDRDQRFLRRQTDGRGARAHRPRDPRHEGFLAGVPQEDHRGRIQPAGHRVRRAPGRGSSDRCGCASCWCRG